MNEVSKLLSENPMGFLATTDAGEPRVRPWGFMFEEEGKYYFCTNSTKDVFRQLQAAPVVEFATMAGNSAWVRLRGRICFTEDVNLKEKVLATSDLVKSIYQKADNPVFKVFYVEHGTAIIGDFSGQPQKQVIF